uniref:OTU domain-containing protein n=2 Tax=Physcomitrium patens TaxID=3218 RepID=A0A7I4EIP2_PHYPA
MRFALWVVLLGSYRVKYCANWMSFHIAASGRASSVASDETIAQTLQEEYDTEAAWEEENASIISTNPLQVPMEAEGDEALDRGRMATSSSLINLIPRNSISSVDGDFELPLILSEDYSHVDKELARRFHELDPIPHSPKVNGVTPSVESANADHHLLLHRLSLYGLTERRIAGDGNCQFRALSDQLYRSPDHHQFVRDKIVSQVGFTLMPGVFLV